MRVVHISDLHAGKNLEKVSRNPDLIYALEQVLEFIKENRVDLLLVAGDVFDKANPDNESKEIILNFFVRLKEIGCPAVVISGNHDSYDFMRSIRRIAELADVYVFDRPDKDNCVFSFHDLGIVCLPYPSERVITEAGEEATKHYADLVERFIKASSRLVQGFKYRILLSHLFIAGSRYTNTEREATITQHYAVSPSALLDTFNYVALGHVHRYQEIKSAPTRAFYTGSMYQLDFSEEGQDKCFNFVTFDEGFVNVEKVVLSLKNPLRVFKIKQGEINSSIDRIRAHSGYVKVVLEVENRYTVSGDLERLKRSVGEKLIKVEQIWDHEKRFRLDYEKMSLKPLDLYREYYRIVHRRKLPKEIERVFLKLVEQAENA